MRYAIEQYDRYGFLKAPKWLWLGWLFLARAWVVFALAGASRESGNKLLALVYPDHDFLYLGLALGLPSIVWLWLISLRRPERTRLNALVSQGRWVTLLSIAAQWAQTAHQVQLTHGTFHWSNAMTLALLTWFAMYVWRSKTVVDCLATPKV